MEALKKERTNAKQAVTKSAKRLLGSAQRGCDFEIVKGLMLELEKAYSDFSDIDSEYRDMIETDPSVYEAYRTVNGMDIEQYSTHVTEVYTQAYEIYVNSKMAEEQLRGATGATPFHTPLKPRMMTPNTDVVTSSPSDTSKDKVMTSSSTMPTIGDLSLVMTSSSSTMSSSTDTMTSSSSVTSSDTMTSSLSRDLNRPTPSPSPRDMRMDRGDDKQSKESDEKLLMSAASKFTPTHTAMGRNTNTSLPPPVHYSNPVDRDPLTRNGMGIFNPRDQMTDANVPTFRSPGPPNGQTSQRSHGMSMNSARFSAPGMISQVPYPQWNYPMPSAPWNMPTMMSEDPGAAAYQQSPMVGNFPVGFHPQMVPQQMMNIQQSVMSQPVPPPFDVKPPFLSTPPRCPPGFAMSQNNGAQWIDRGNGSYEERRNQRNDIKLEKITLPTFSGHRKDWPEFKTVWKELAEKGYSNKTALAHQLKKAVKGEALARIRSVYITKPEAYEEMWKKLEAYYNNTSASIQAALDGLQKLKPVSAENYKGLVELVDEVESTYNQLEELKVLDALNMRDVDRINNLLPSHLKLEWNRLFYKLQPDEKVKPISQFMDFLKRERDTVARLAETQPKFSDRGDKKHQSTPQKMRGQSNHGTATTENNPKKFYSCAYHKKQGIKHTTEKCKEFLKLPVNGEGVKSRISVLREVNACFKCFEDHRQRDCPATNACSTCGKSNHHSLICRMEASTHQVAAEPTEVGETVAVAGDTYLATSEELMINEEAKIEGKVNSSMVKSRPVALYAIQNAPVPGSGKEACIFFDGGSDTTYVTHRAANSLNLKKIYKLSMEITTMGGIRKDYDTWQYEVPLMTKSGRKVTVLAYGMDKITGQVMKLNTKVVGKLFPDYEPDALQRKSTYVDLLLGCEYFGFHPKQEVASAGEHLSIMQGEFGICLQGSHPDLSEATQFDANFAKTVHGVVLKGESHHISSREYTAKFDAFIRGQELATAVTPRCGSCRCGKCPIMGQTYSFKEEQELKMIRENLEYDEENRCWLTSYPWIKDPKDLPDNYSTALATLRNTEQRLKKDDEWAKAYEDQVQDMLNRGVARYLTPKEIAEWNGPKFYISHLAVFNPKSNSTPIRIVFNSSQLHKGVSLNSCLAKGPDCYLNNLIGLLLRWREESVAIVGDIKKMFHSVHLKPLEQQCHRFLWRNLDTSREPDVLVMNRVNFGDRPAPAITTEAIYQTANKFEADSTQAAKVLKDSTYVDDIIDSVPTWEDARRITQETEKMLEKGGFKVKCWQFSGDHEVSELTKSGDRQSLLKGNKDKTRVLGVVWKHNEDVMVFEVTLNFSKKKKGCRTETDLRKEDVPKMIPTILTRRIVLEQVMGIYDPLGLVSPFTLQARVYLRETWEIRIGWDDPLPQNLRDKWVSYFKLMFDLENLEYSRCLHPDDAVGKPWMIVLSDGSDLGYGAVAYVRYKLKNGSFWCRLIMSKYRIAPLNKVSTPQMELNGAVVSKRIRQTIESEMRFDFEKVIQIVDSETVLNMINKTSTRFKVYEGVRIGEIQAATNGDISCWAWIAGVKNTADLLTRGKNPEALGPTSEWWCGPAILYEPHEEWGLKFGLQKDGNCPGEKKIFTSHNADADSVSSRVICYTRVSKMNILINAIARIHAVFRLKSFKGGRVENLTVEDYRKAEASLVRDMQSEFTEEMMKKKKGGKFGTLNPVKNSDGIWVVGARMYGNNPDAPCQMLVPTSHRGARLLMVAAHEEGHLGINATLAKFRRKYWVPHGDKLAKSVKHRCQACRKKDVVLLSQQMGALPDARLGPAPPFNQTMLDLFGPYPIRGEVQKRTTGKAYGVIFTDLASRAVHIEVTCAYDTSSFLLALRRFAAIRGWPQFLYSDPGSQLVGANKELKDAWENVDRDQIKRLGLKNGMTWVFGPADSPWNQGAVEALVKSAKRAIHFAVHNQRLSAPEFLTVCTEAANLLNERPIGTKPSTDADINILTPNLLLLGRAEARNPCSFVNDVESLSTRYHLVEFVVEKFWKNWSMHYAPHLVIQSKWKTSTRNVKVGDVVLIADNNTLRGEYRLGVVRSVFEGKDRKVRSVDVAYKNFKAGEKFHEYKGAKDMIVRRSVQRLSVLVPIDEQ